MDDEGEMAGVCEAAIALIEAERSVDRWEWDGLSTTEEMIAEEASANEAYGRLCDAVGHLLSSRSRKVT